jgi:hypothetical protein
MSYAPFYTPTTSFANDEANQAAGRSTVRTTAVDTELANIKSSVNALKNNLEKIQRDDDEIRDQMVKLHTLAPEVLKILSISGSATPRGQWLTATAYGLKDLVSQNSNTYISTTAHTSGVFATDFSAGKWLLFQLGSTTAASSIPFASTPTLAAVNVQDAINESDIENRALSAAATAAAADTFTQLASSALGKGAALVGYQRPATSSIATTVYNQINSRSPSVFDFMTAAQINDVVANTKLLDVSAPWAAAIAHCKLKGIGRLLAPYGTHLLSSFPKIDFPLKIVGEGNGFYANAGFSATIGTRLFWNGSSVPGAASEFITFTNCNFGGWGLESIDIDCNSLATKALTVADSVGGKFVNVSCRNFRLIGLHLNSTLALNTNTNSWHDFNGLNVESITAGVTECVRLSGVVGGGNACHNTFTNLRIAHANSAHAITLGGCDNNSFTMTFIYQVPGGTGKGLKVDGTEYVGFPTSNLFFHLEAGPGGIDNPTNVGGPYNAIQVFGYALDNGQPYPFSPNGGVFAITDAGQMMGLTSFGKSIGNNFLFTATYVGGATARAVALPTPEIDANYLPLVFPRIDPGARYFVNGISTSQFFINITTAPVGNIDFDVVIIRR